MKKLGRTRRLLPLFATLLVPLAFMGACSESGGVITGDSSGRQDLVVTEMPQASTAQSVAPIVEATEGSSDGVSSAMPPAQDAQVPRSQDSSVDSLAKPSSVVDIRSLPAGTVVGE